MCGIAGIVDFGGKAVETSLLLAMNQAVAHRGPDDEGYILIDRERCRWRDYAGPGSAAGIKERLPLLTSMEDVQGTDLGLSHRRFSIIDLTEAGHQPFFDHERSCCVVFNGEIYNYVELKEELVAAGVIFQSHSDTEVLLEAYKYWGTDCFARFNGFWALALYDFRKKQLVLSRDRIGKKPLYWSRVGQRLYFASEIKALLQAPDVHSRMQVNEKAVGRWLAYGRKDLDFLTCYEGIESFPSASWAVVTPAFPQGIRRFWAVPSERWTESALSVTEAARTLRTLLEDAVKIRLRADVPVSVELSGGMDSSTLVALAAQLHPGKIDTYTVRFPDKKWNEEPFARSVAQHYNTNYRVLESPTANFWSQARLFTYLQEEPYHSPNLQTNQVIWSQMRSMGTKVSLNGAGGDENFAGYGWYFSLFQRENLVSRRFLTYLENGVRYSSGRTHFNSLVRPALTLAKDVMRAAVRGRGSTQLPADAEIAPASLTTALYADMTNTLMPYWLRSGDRSFMGVPLEVRAPFLDYRVIEFAFRLPTTYLIRDGWHKWILRKAVEDLLPKDVVWRRQKMGFPFPYERFFAENAEIINLILANAENPYLDFSKSNSFRHDWKTISFLLWYELFFNENLALFDKIEAKANRMYSVEDFGYTPQFLAAAVQG